MILMHDFSGWLYQVFVSNWDTWAVIGIIGQFAFTMRFVVQWIASELAKKSVVPFAFWIFSLIGGGILLIYSIFRKDPVFIIGNLLGFCVYVRNIWLILAEKKRKGKQAETEEQSAAEMLSEEVSVPAPERAEAAR